MTYGGQLFDSDPNRFEHLSKLDIFRKIDDIHRVRDWRNLSYEEIDDLTCLQNQLRVHEELEKVDGIRR